MRKNDTILLLMASTFGLLVGVGGCARDIAPYEEVVSLWKNGKMSADKRGVLSLPEKYAALSSEGEACVTQLPDGKHKAVLFIRRRERATNMDGILYTDMTPQPKQGTEITIKMTIPSSVGPPGFKGMIVDETIVVEKVIKQGWYSVRTANLE
jgi:hypothetical protein